MAKLINFRFDDTAEGAAKLAEQMAGKLITEITDETERAIRNVITEAIREGIPPYDAARMVVPMIGLRSDQAQAVMNYREQLIDNGLAIDTVNKKVDEYSDELLTSRSETIARSEIMDALNAGADEAYSQAQEKGLLSEDATKEVILTDGACEECVSIADEGPVPINEDFSEDGPPFHPNCRCTTAIATP
jgi:hypothetical protein